MRNRRHAIGVRFAALVDRDVFTGHEMFVGEMVADFVGQIGLAVIMEAPCAAGVVYEMTMLVLLVGTQARNPAGLAVMLP